MNFIKKNFPVLFLVLLNFLFLVFYLHRSTANIVYSDQFYTVDMVVKRIYEKNFNLFAILARTWNEGGMHKSIGGVFLTLINLKFFKLNTLVDMYSSAFVLLLTVLVLYFYYNKNLTGNKLLPRFFFLLISFIVLSLDQVELLTFGNGLYLFLRMFLFIITFIVFEQFIKKFSLRNLIFFSIPLFVNLFFFSGGYTIPFFIGLIVILFVDYLNNDSIKINKISLIITLGIILFSSIVYSIGGFNQTLPYSLDPLSKVIFPVKLISHQPFNFLRFTLLSLTGNIVDVNIISTPSLKIADNLLLTIGVLLMLIYFYAIYLFFQNKLYKKTYLPLFFIIYSFFIYLSVGMTRFGFSHILPYYSMSSRYTADTHFGLIGIIWIIALVYVDKLKLTKINFKKIILPVLIVIFIMIGQIFTIKAEWKAGPYRKIYFDNLRKIALEKNKTKKELKLFEVYDLKLVEKSLNFLEKHGLNVYAD